MKRAIFTMVLVGLLGLAQAQNNSLNTVHIDSITAISRVLGDGRKVEAVVLKYDAPIRNRSLSTHSYSVEGKEVTRIYANTAPQKAPKGVDGCYVVVETKAEVDLNAQPKQPTTEEMAEKKERDKMQVGPGLRAGWSTGGKDEYPGNAVVTQIADIKTTRGTTYKASRQAMASTAERCLVADDFKQEEFVSPYTGQTLPYNIYLPDDYSPEQQYPLVLFIHDAGVASNDVKQPLYQGNGATSWAEPEAQARHKCIVVAPEYPVITVDDNFN